MIRYYYVLYLTDNTIHLIPFPTRDKTKEYQKGCDECWKDKGRFLYSTITKKDIEKTGEFWVH